MISPSPDILLSAISTPTSTPSGTVNVSVNGIASANSCATVAGGAELRTRISNSLPARCRNSTKVNSTAPNSAFLDTSRKIEREQQAHVYLPFAPAADGRHRLRACSGGGGTMGGFGVSSSTGASSISSNNTAGAITEAVVMKEPAAHQRKRALESIKSKT